MIVAESHRPLMAPALCEDVALVVLKLEYILGGYTPLMGDYGPNKIESKGRGFQTSGVDSFGTVKSEADSLVDNT